MVESNKLMAEFLGYKYYPEKDNGYIGWRKPNTPILSVNNIVVNDSYLCRNHQQLKFDTNWNWLMQVVEKIEDLGFTVHIGGHMCKIENIEQMIKAITLQPTKIQAVYSACLQFIQNESNN